MQKRDSFSRNSNPKEPSQSKPLEAYKKFGSKLTAHMGPLPVTNEVYFSTSDDESSNNKSSTSVCKVEISE